MIVEVVQFLKITNSSDQSNGWPRSNGEFFFSVYEEGIDWVIYRNTEVIKNENKSWSRDMNVTLADPIRTVWVSELSSFPCNLWMSRVFMFSGAEGFIHHCLDIAHLRANPTPKENSTEERETDRILKITFGLLYLHFSGD